MLYIIVTMTRTQLYLPQTQYEELKILASKYGQTFAAYTRKLLEERVKEIKQNKRPSKSTNPLAHLLKSLKKIEKWQEPGVTRYGSTRHDEILYSRKALFGK